MKHLIEDIKINITGINGELNQLAVTMSKRYTPYVYNILTYVQETDNTYINGSIQSELMYGGPVYTCVTKGLSTIRILNKLGIQTSEIYNDLPNHMKNMCMCSTNIKNYHMVYGTLTNQLKNPYTFEPIYALKYKPEAYSTHLDNETVTLTFGLSRENIIIAPGLTAEPHNIVRKSLELMDQINGKELSYSPRPDASTFRITFNYNMEYTNKNKSKVTIKDIITEHQLDNVLFGTSDECICEPVLFVDRMVLFKNAIRCITKEIYKSNLLGNILDNRSGYDISNIKLNQMLSYIDPKYIKASIDIFKEEIENVDESIIIEASNYIMARSLDLSKAETSNIALISNILYLAIKKAIYISYVAMTKAIYKGYV